MTLFTKQRKQGFVFSLFLFIVCFAIPQKSMADDTSMHETVVLAWTADQEKILCASLQASSTPWIWRGVHDMRPNPRMGWQDNAQGVVEIHHQPALEAYWNEQFPKLLQTCGVRLVSEGDYPAVSLRIQKFEVVASKKVFTGKSHGQVEVLLVVDRSSSIQTAQVGFSNESKKMRQKDTRLLRTMMQELWFEVHRHMLAHGVWKGSGALSQN